MEPLLMMLIWVLVLALICYLIFWALSQIPLPQPIRAVVVVIVAIIMILFLVNKFGLL